MEEEWVRKSRKEFEGRVLLSEKEKEKIKDYAEFISPMVYTDIIKYKKIKPEDVDIMIEEIKSHLPFHPLQSDLVAPVLRELAGCVDEAGSGTYAVCYDDAMKKLSAVEEYFWNTVKEEIKTYIERYKTRKRK